MRLLFMTKRLYRFTTTNKCSCCSNYQTNELFLHWHWQRRLLLSDRRNSSDRCCTLVTWSHKVIMCYQTWRLPASSFCNHTKPNLTNRVIFECFVQCFEAITQQPQLFRWLLSSHKRRSPTSLGALTSAVHCSRPLPHLQPCRPTVCRSNNRISLICDILFWCLFFPKRLTVQVFSYI